jgi:hypothetical protein
MDLGAYFLLKSASYNKTLEQKLLPFKINPKFFFVVSRSFAAVFLGQFSFWKETNIGFY